MTRTILPRILHQTRRGKKAGPLLCLVVCVVSLTLAAGTVRADEVMMANGDRITGEVQTLVDGKVTVKTPYNDALELDWASVKGIVLQAPTEILLKDGTVLMGTTELSAMGGIDVVTQSAGKVAIGDLSLIQAINPPKKPPVSYKGDAQASASFTSGNSDTASGNLSAKFVARSKRQRLTLRGGWNYTEDTGRVSSRDANGSIKYDFFAYENLYTYVNSLLEYNAPQDLSLRSTIGGGLGYQILESDRAGLSFELGVSYFNANYKIAPDKAYASGRWSVNADYKIIPDKIALFHFHEGYFGFDDLADIYIRSEQGVRFTVIKDFYTTFQANITYDNTPAVGTKKTDTTLLFGLGYSFDL